MSDTDDQHTAGKYRTEIAITWTVVLIPLAYGIINSVKAGLDLFSG